MWHVPMTYIVRHGHVRDAYIYAESTSLSPATALLPVQIYVCVDDVVVVLGSGECK